MKIQNSKELINSL